MRKFALFCSALCLSATMFAQSTPQPQRLISEVNVATPKSGMVEKFEAGRKAHSAFHAAQKDTWSVFVWEITSGERSGSYLMTSPGHHWADFDARADFLKLDTVDVAKNMAPYATTVTSYFAFRDDLSLSKPPATPSAMRTATYYTVIPEHLGDFIESMKKLNAASQNMNDPTRPSRVYALSNGGNGPQFVIVTERATWADMEPMGMTTEDLLKAAYGADEGTKILNQFRASIDHVRSEMAVYRPDLSYVPK